MHFKCYKSASLSSKFPKIEEEHKLDYYPPFPSLKN